MVISTFYSLYIFAYMVCVCALMNARLCAAPRTRWSSVGWQCQLSYTLSS